MSLSFPKYKRKKTAESGKLSAVFFLFKTVSASAGGVAAIGADVVNGQLVILDGRADLRFERCGEGGEMDIGDLSAFVAKEMIVRFGDLVKAIGNAVDVEAVDQSRFVHGVEVVSLYDDVVSATKVQSSCRMSKFQP